MMIILVHGGLHGGWCWDQVLPPLRAAGLSVIAPDLPGMGSDKTPLSEVTLASTADFVADLVRRQSEKVVLVGHSMAGPVISECAERAPENILGLVYVAANLVPSGLSMREAAAGSLDNVMSGVLVSEDGISSTYEPNAAFDVFYNTTDPEEARRAIGRLTPQPIAPTIEAVSTTPERFGKTPRAYIECLQDRAISIELQRRMQAVLPCDPVVSMNCDHSPFLCAPNELAEHIRSIAALFELRTGRDALASECPREEGR